MTKLEQFPEASACRLLVTRLYEYLGAIGPAVSKLSSCSKRNPDPSNAIGNVIATYNLRL